MDSKLYVLNMSFTSKVLKYKDYRKERDFEL